MRNAKYKSLRIKDTLLWNRSFPGEALSSVALTECGFLPFCFSLPPLPLPHCFLPSFLWWKWARGRLYLEPSNHGKEGEFYNKSSGTLGKQRFLILPFIGTVMILQKVNKKILWKFYVNQFNKVENQKRREVFKVNLLHMFFSGAEWFYNVHSAPGMTSLSSSSWLIRML